MKNIQYIIYQKQDEFKFEEWEYNIKYLGYKTKEWSAYVEGCPTVVTDFWEEKELVKILRSNNPTYLKPVQMNTAEEFWDKRYSGFGNYEPGTRIEDLTGNLDAKSVDLIKKKIQETNNKVRYKSKTIEKKIKKSNKNKHSKKQGILNGKNVELIPNKDRNNKIRYKSKTIEKKIKKSNKNKQSKKRGIKKC